MDWVVIGITFFIMARAIYYIIDDYKRELVDIEKRGERIKKEEYAKGFIDGYECGHTDGYEDGLEKGMEDGTRMESTEQYKDGDTK